MKSHKNKVSLVNWQLLNVCFFDKFSLGYKFVNERKGEVSNSRRSAEFTFVRDEFETISFRQKENVREELRLDLNSNRSSPSISQGVQKSNELISLVND